MTDRTSNLRSLLGEARGYVISFAAITKHPTAPADAHNLTARIDAALKATSGETTTEPKAGDPVWVSPVFGCPTDGWTIDRVERKTTVYLKHPNGSLITCPPEHWGLKAVSVKASAEPAPCEHLRSDVLAEKKKDEEPLFQMHKCLDCKLIFRVRSSLKTPAEPAPLLCRCADPEPALTDHGLNSICEKCYRPIHGEPT